MIILESRLDKNIFLMFFDNHIIGKVTFYDFQVSSTRRVVLGVEICLTTLKGRSFMLAATI